jgi:hypothetical protein
LKLLYCDFLADKRERTRSHYRVAMFIVCIHGNPYDNHSWVTRFYVSCCSNAIHFWHVDIHEYSLRVQMIDDINPSSPSEATPTASIS